MFDLFPVAIDLLPGVFCKLDRCDGGAGPAFGLPKKPNKVDCFDCDVELVERPFMDEEGGIMNDSWAFESFLFYKMNEKGKLR